MEQMDFSIEVSESEIEKFADYLYQKENAKATINKYMADIKKFLSFLTDDKRINKKVLLQYKEWLVQKYAVNSVNSMLAALNQFLEFLNVGKLKVKRIKVQKQPFLQDQKELTEKECRKLIATAMAEGKEQLALCIETIACTGIRISEIKFLTVERVKSGKIEIYNKGKYRRIFLPKVLQRKLLSYCHNNQIAEGWIFVTKNGKLKDRSNIWREMKRLKEKAGVAESKIFPHNFRHLFARIYYVELPIYHGTSEAVLQAGVGHFWGTSLPVGGESTHTVLTGHRGLPTKTLFTNMDKLEVGDIFYIKVLDETLAYQIDQILTVLPQETDSLSIEPGKDYATLVTCTPFAINTHRLLVRGERIPYEEATKQEPDTNIKPELSFTAKVLIVTIIVIFIGLMIAVIYSIRDRKRRKVR